MTSMDRRALLTAMVGAGVAVGALGAAATSVMAVPRAKPPRPDTDRAAAVPQQPGVEDEGKARLHKAQYIVIRRRPRRRWWWRRPRGRVYFY